jgi:YidC/Oxa1 family membrane protein insertase
VHAVKEFHIDPSSYLIAFHAVVEDGERALSPTIAWGPAIGDHRRNQPLCQEGGRHLFQDGKVVRLAPKDIGKQPVRDGDFRYGGVDDNYFLIAALFPDRAGSRSSRSRFRKRIRRRRRASWSRFPSSPHAGDSPVKFFAGPKDFDVLSSIDRDLARAIDFGMFTVIVVPLLRSLKWVNGYVGNYGWAIIILTFFINVILFPLRHKSVVSMRKMQEIQPQVKAIQERYKNLKATDPEKQKMNTEMMALYKEKGVNPAAAACRCC